MAPKNEFTNDVHTHVCTTLISQYLLHILIILVQDTEYCLVTKNKFPNDAHTHVSTLCLIILVQDTGWLQIFQMLSTHVTDTDPQIYRGGWLA